MLGGDAHHTVLVKGELVTTLLNHLDIVYHIISLTYYSSLIFFQAWTLLCLSSKGQKCHMSKWPLMTTLSLPS